MRTQTIDQNTIRRLPPDLKKELQAQVDREDDDLMAVVVATFDDQNHMVDVDAKELMTVEDYEASDRPEVHVRVGAIKKIM